MPEDISGYKKHEILMFLERNIFWSSLQLGQSRTFTVKANSKSAFLSTYSDNTAQTDLPVTSQSNN